MRDFVKVSPTVWQSKKFKPLPEDNKVFYFYCLSSPHATSAGYYKIHIGYMMADLEWEKDKILSSISALKKAGLIDYDFDESIIIIDNWFNFNPPTNPNHANKIFSDILSIGFNKFKHECLLRFSACLKAKGWTLNNENKEELRKALESLSEALPKHSPTRPDQTETRPDGDGDQTRLPVEKTTMEKKALAVDIFKMPDQTILNFDQLFERFWNLYPSIRSKGHKGKAKEELKTQFKKGKNYEIIGRGIAKYRKYCDSTGEKQPDMFRWLKSEGWDSDFSIPSTHAAKPRGGSGYSIEDVYDKAMADTTNRSEGREERLKALGIIRD